MNSAFDDNHAGSQGRFARRAAHAALACALVLGSGLAVAQQRGDRDYGGQPQQQQAERFRSPQERDMRYDDQRDQRHGQQQQQQYQQQYQQQPQQESQDQRRSGRMTADERREMRRQVNEAKDFYPQRH